MGFRWSDKTFAVCGCDGCRRHIAKSNHARIANPNRSKTDLCLSPSSLSKLDRGDRVVLPSPNGSTISFSIENSKVICGSLRNAKAVAAAASEIGKTVLVIAAGELWDGKTLRPSLERIYPEDCELAARLNISETVPILNNKAFSHLT